ncbi:DUF4192 domain-containing protein [Humibacillus xanthopallidus]|uniref:Uncharacterized protein DUF4192 n=1 Tax=Humibacillus xanthopallidus TaxID=412689 RepID=A0A543HHM3_9MICO|nr:DUF4192 domain-containing protein [Humibacillus xanthopallidus]TQM57826.1 uncharacterized protein DUF4192 [Humibacillus xanthopallidus]
MTAPPITLRSLAELLAVIPHLLGFEPAHSIVVMALRDTKLSLTQRMDLPDPDRATEVAHTLARHVLKDEAEAVLLVGYETTRGESLPLLEALSEQLRTDGIATRDRLVVHDGRWRSLDCDRPTCCPPDGRPLPAPAEVASTLAEFVGHGSAPLPNRTALAQLLEPGPAAAEFTTLLDRGRKARTTLTREQALRRLADVWARILTIDTDPISLGDVAVALQSLTAIPVRDGIIALLVPGTLARDALSEDVGALLEQITDRLDAQGQGLEDADRPAVQARLVLLCQHATDWHAAPVLTVLAAYAWWHGDGAIARVAMDRAPRADPGYRLARLLQLMLDERIRPDRP